MPSHEMTIWVSHLFYLHQTRISRGDMMCTRTQTIPESDGLAFDRHFILYFEVKSWKILIYHKFNVCYVLCLWWGDRIYFFGYNTRKSKNVGIVVMPSIFCSLYNHFWFFVSNFLTFLRLLWEKTRIRNRDSI